MILPFKSPPGNARSDAAADALDELDAIGRAVQRAKSAVRRVPEAGAPVLVFSPADLPATWNGVSVYGGVVVCWDEDRDTRVLGFLDSLRPATRAAIVAVHERKGTVEIVWRSCPVADPAIGADRVEVYKDVWVLQSRTICGVEVVA